jgi:ABC-type uncharacterized transport system involved in gliding motility auxiliary subunit
MSTFAKRSFWKTSGGVAGLLVLLVILFAANIILGKVRGRIDCTEQKLYTLSNGTKDFLKKLDQPVTLTLFFSSSATEAPVYLKNHARQVEDLLREYAIAAGGNIEVDTLDPKPDSDAEELAQKYGITGQNVGMFGPPIYFGLVAAAGKSEGAIPFIDPRAEGLLEYNITRLISRTVTPEKPRLGILSSLPVMGTPQEMMQFAPQRQRAKPWLAFRDLSEDYEVQELPPSTETIDSAIKTLVMIHPKELSEKTQYAIDQFVLRGGRLLAFVDPLCIADMESQPPQQPFGRPESSSNLEKLFKAWGVGYDPGKIVADPRAITRLQGGNNQVDENLMFLTLGKSALSKDDILTASLETLTVPLGGCFTDQTKGGLTFTPLVKASPLAGLVDSMTAQFGGAAVRRDLKPATTPPVIAVRLAGKFKTAFPEGMPRDAAGDADKDKKDELKPDASYLKEGDGSVVLVADVDMLYDRFCVEELNFFGAQAYRPRNNNLTLFGNIVEQLSGSSALIGIRSRGSFERPFERVVELEENARKEWQTREQELEKELQETRQQLSQLQTQKDQTEKFILSAEQKEALQRFRDAEIRINGELKEVRKSLRKDIETLGWKVKFVNIALMPILISLVGIAYGVRRRKNK